MPVPAPSNERVRTHSRDDGTVVEVRTVSMVMQVAGRRPDGSLILVPPEFSDPRETARVAELNRNELGDMADAFEQEFGGSPMVFPIPEGGVPVYDASRQFADAEQRARDSGDPTPFTTAMAEVRVRTTREHNRVNPRFEPAAGSDAKTNDPPAR